MKKDISQEAAKLSSFLKMEDLEIQEKVINLGKKIVESLKLSESNEIAEWMANYIAEKIHKAEDNTDRNEEREECFETILKLWEYRAYLPNGSRPFEQFEEALKALSSLAPESHQYRYYSASKEEPENLSEVVKNWIELGKKLDTTAKILVSFSFKQAFIAAKEQSTIDWLQSVKDTVNSDELNIIFKVLDDGFKESEEDEKIKLLTKRIEQLEAFEAISSKLRGDLNAEIVLLKKRNDK